MPQTVLSIMCSYSESRKVYAFGNNSEGQLGITESNSPNVPAPSQVQLPTVTVKMMSAGNDHSVLLTGKLKMSAWR